MRKHGTFLGLVITYLPVLYQTFSRREVPISLLDARAGSPPRAVELVRRLGEYNDLAALRPLLIEWERWCAELLESHLSYPQLAYFRSQHTNQSWLAALTAILDTCALIIAGVNDGPTRQAQLTFAMARHAVEGPRSDGIWRRQAGGRGRHVAGALGPALYYGRWRRPDAARRRPRRTRDR